MEETRDDRDPRARREILEQELLAVRCQLGEPEAFTELVDRWHEALWRYARATAGDAAVAEEVIQEACPTPPSSPS